MSNPSIILATVNARYSHAAFGLRWIWANMGPLRGQTEITCEFCGVVTRI